jgi:ribosomal protein S18 acetylase RimI-like enzyme
VTSVFQIRRAGPDDAERLTALARESFLETFVHGFRIPYPPEDLEAFMAQAYAAGPSRERLADPEQAVWFGERAGEAFAYAAVGPAGLPHPDVRPEHGEIRALYVLRAAQDSGLGQTLMETALAWLEERDLRPVWLGVWSGNLKAQRFYEKYGFEKQGEYEFPVGEWRDLEFILRRG